MKDGEAKKRILEKISREMGSRIEKLLKNSTVNEIMVNANGEIWAEYQSSGMWMRGHLSSETREALICSVASYLGEEVGPNSPILEAEFPLDQSRFEAILPPVVEAPVFSIRKHSSKPRLLHEYIDDKSLSKEDASKIIKAIFERKNILVAGGTGSGKTTFVNCLISLMADIFHSQRLLILEDTREIQAATKNSVFLRTSRTVSMRDLLRATLRLRPDRIIVGEVRGGEALDLLKAWTTGHPGGISTIHANDARSALYRLEQLAAEVTVKPMQRLISEAVDIIVVIQKTSFGREITEILELTEFNNQGYALKTLE